MDELSKEYIISFYNKALAMHGDTPEALRWTQRGQFLHYQSLLDIAETIAGRKILDFGCGKGDFCQFLHERNISVDYTGVDINEGLISLAKQKFPCCRFKVFDSERDELGEDFDYIFLCGVFNLKMQGLDELIRDILRKLFNRCRIGMAFNALSSHNPKKDFELHYLSPEEMVRFTVTNLSPYFSLRHDRMAYDFTLFVYRDLNIFAERVWNTDRPDNP
jgi:SAM-dependent methyltransferase